MAARSECERTLKAFKFKLFTDFENEEFKAYLLSSVQAINFKKLLATLPKLYINKM